MYFFMRKRGAIGPTQLIAIILLLTAIGIGVYYYQQSKPSEPGKTEVTIKSVSFPIEPALAEETRKNKNIVYGGIPKTQGKLPLLMLHNIAYHSGYSDDRRNPIWVAYKLDAKESGEKLKRPKGFKTDTRTSTRIAAKDYVKSGYDRGHMAPNSAIASRFGLDAQLETFLMSNIVAQTPDLNRKIWQRLERLEEEYANQLETVWVFTGPVFDEHIQTITNNIEVPDAFYKILLDEEKGGLKTLAFIMPQTVTGKEPVEHFLTSIDEIEKLTGLDFLWPLSDEVEDRLEAAAAKKLW